MSSSGPKRFVELHILHLDRCRTRSWGKESFGQLMHFGQAIYQVLRQLGTADPHQTGNPLDPIRRTRHLVGLRVMNHLDAVFDFAVRAVMIGQLIGNILRHPPFGGQRRQTGTVPRTRRSASRPPAIN